MHRRATKLLGQRAFARQPLQSTLPVANTIKRFTFLFDLDDTLHDASHALFGAIDERMTQYVAQHLQLDLNQANAIRAHYWQRYGATLLGLVRHHAINPQHFLHATHDLNIAALLRAERGLAAMLKKLPGKKLLFTNAPNTYAQQVLALLRLKQHLPRGYAIESMRVHQVLRPKPSVTMLRHLIARERLCAQRTVLVEDTPRNLKAAQAVGIKTVLVMKGPVGSSRYRQAQGRYIGLRVRSVLKLPRALMRLRR